jgi:hypothetical protein
MYLSLYCSGLLRVGLLLIIGVLRESVKGGGSRRSLLIILGVWGTSLLFIYFRGVYPIPPQVERVNYGCSDISRSA